MLTHTIGFIARGRELLMLNRKKAPMKGFWHGVGGKLRPGENPQQGIIRNIRAMTDIRAAEGDLRFAGIMLLDFAPDSRSGMYVFVLHLPPDAPYPQTPLQTDEGILHWLPQDWLSAPDNRGVSEHIRRLLPVFLGGAAPHEFHIAYDGNNLTELEAFPLYTDSAAK